MAKENVLEEQATGEYKKLAKQLEGLIGEIKSKDIQLIEQIEPLANKAIKGATIGFIAGSLYTILKDKNEADKGGCQYVAVNNLLDNAKKGAIVGLVGKIAYDGFLKQALGDYIKNL